MDPTASSALSGSGSASIQSGCGVMVDSSSSSAIALSGSATVTAPAIGVVGGYTGGGSASFTPTPKTGVIAASDPLAYVQAPTVGSCAHTNLSVNNGGTSGSYYQLYAGTYCGGITLSNGFVNFNAGTYVLAGGGLTANGGPVMTGTGITFYNTTGTGGYQAITLTGGSTCEFQRADLGIADGNPVFSGSLDTGQRRGQHRQRQFEFDFRRSALLPDDDAYLQREQQPQRLQHRGRGQGRAQRQFDDRHQLQLACRRLADKGNDTGRMIRIMTTKPIQSFHAPGSMRPNGSRPGRGRAGGQVMVLICVSLIAIMGMIAVVTDFSFMQHQKNMMQTAADSAAMAGSEELSYGDQVAAGKADAASNGYTDGANSVTVTINNPPTSGPNAANTAYVEAIVSKPRADLFSAGARSEHDDGVDAGGRVRGQRAELHLRDESVGLGRDVGQRQRHGQQQLRSAGGLELVERFVGHRQSFDHRAEHRGGGRLQRPTATRSFSPTPKTGVIAASDPLAYVAAPTVGSCAHTNFSLNGNNGSSGSPYQLYAGTYCGGISVNGNSVLHFNAGTYVLAGGGMNINANSTMTGTGVTFYNTTGTGGYGAITMNGNSQANFSAPTSGPLAGILFFQDRSIPSNSAPSTINGNSSSTFDGAIYFATTTVNFNGNSSSSGYSIVVANQLVLNGNSSLGSNYSSLTNGSPIKGTILAE